MRPFRYSSQVEFRKDPKLIKAPEPLKVQVLKAASVPNGHR
jgi:hypothetical protein